MLDAEYKFYKDNQKELLDKYEGRYVVIQGQSVLGHYSSEVEAYNETRKKYEVGTFLIQKVSREPEGYSQSFHSRVVFPSHNLVP
jgi:hypothetical protein